MWPFETHSDSYEMGMGSSMVVSIVLCSVSRMSGVRFMCHPIPPLFKRWKFQRWNVRFMANGKG